MKKILLLGSGELGKEVTISAKRLGCTVIAVDNYPNAPAMQVADSFEVISMLDGKELENVITKHKPDFIVPEIEAIRTEKLLEFEKDNYTVIPTAIAAHLTMNRDAIRDVASEKLGIRTAKYAYANSLEELVSHSKQIGFPLVIKPVMSSSGKGQSTVHSTSELPEAWEFACKGMRGDQKKIILEEFIKFEQEITLLTVKQKNAETLFVKPIGHRQERGDYQESWLPADITNDRLEEAKKIAKKVTDHLGGQGLFGVEFFITKNETIFSELSPRPHDTGMVTLVSQNLSEFDLHVRAILGLPIPEIKYLTPAAASSVILANENGHSPNFTGVDKALAEPNTEIRIFGKQTARPYRRMAVALATGDSIDQARNTANHVAGLIECKLSN